MALFEIWSHKRYLFQVVVGMATANMRELIKILAIKFKGYLRYEKITSPNASSRAQVKNFFIS